MLCNQAASAQETGYHSARGHSFGDGWMGGGIDRWTDGEWGDGWENVGTDGWGEWGDVWGMGGWKGDGRMEGWMGDG